MAITNYYRSDGWVKNVNGPAVPGAQIYVCSQPANVSFLPPTPLALIYADAGLTPITQPIITDGFGHYDFYALPGLYAVIVAYGGNVQQVYPDQSIGAFGSGGSVSTLLLETNSTPNFNQSVLNVIQGAGMLINTDNLGNMTITNTNPSPYTASVIPGTAVLPGVRGTGTDNNWAGYTMATALFSELIINPVSKFTVTFSSIGGTGVSIANCVFLKTSRSNSTVLSSTPITFNGGHLPYAVAYSGFSATNPYYLVSDVVNVAIDNQHDYYIYMYLDADATHYNQNLILWGNASSSSSGLAFQRLFSSSIPSVGGSIPDFPWTGGSAGSYPGNSGGSSAEGVPTIVSVLAA